MSDSKNDGVFHIEINNRRMNTYIIQYKSKRSKDEDLYNEEVPAVSLELAIVTFKAKWPGRELIAVVCGRKADMNILRNISDKIKKYYCPKQPHK